MLVSIILAVNTTLLDVVINVNGHRLVTASFEDAINSHEAAVESAVVGL